MTSRAPALAADIDAATLLALWERGLGRTAWARDETLLRAWPDDDPPARTIGERNGRLLRLHARLFGPALDLLSQCPACGTTAQFSGDCATLAAGMHAIGVASSHRLEMQGHLIEFRVPDGSDLAEVETSDQALQHADDFADDFAWRVLDRCVLTCLRDGAPLSVRELPEAVLTELSQRLEALDPGASVSFTLECPQCATPWESRLDVGQLVWQKIRAAAEHLLLDIDALARAYGWTEADTLRLSPVRRVAYLQMVNA